MHFRNVAPTATCLATRKFPWNSRFVNHVLRRSTIPSRGPRSVIHSVSREWKAPPRRCCVLHLPPKDAGAPASAFAMVARAFAMAARAFAMAARARARAARASHVATVDEDGLEEGLRRGK